MASTQYLLFGGGINNVKKSALAAALGRGTATLARWQKNPGMIQLDDLRALVRIRGLTDGEIIQIVRGR